MLNMEMVPIRCAIYRGGTSKAIFFLENDLPKDQELRDKIILSVFGSPDPRQIDGLGGAEPLTSKSAIISVSSEKNIDVNYTFGQVNINKPFIDYSSNCGNISSAVGPFAIENGLVNAVEPITKVVIYNTNTKRRFIAEVPVSNGKPQVIGDYNIYGVPTPGAEIKLDMAGTAGGKTGHLLPTGNTKDIINLKTLKRQITVSIIDAGSPTIFIKADDINLSGIETPKEIDSNKSLLDLLEKIRCIGAKMAGLVEDETEAHEKLLAIPMVAFVSKPKNYISHITGEKITPDSYDFLSRLMFMQITHKTYSGTASVATGTAAVIPNTVVNDLIDKNKKDNIIRIGHPAGIMSVEMGIQKDTQGNYKLTRAAYGRTARQIMQGYTYIPSTIFK